MRLRASPCLVGLVTLAMGPLAEAKTYRWVNDQGIVTYSDQPPQVRPVEGEREALINEALDISGTKKALETIPAHIRAQFEARQTPLKPEEKARVVKILGDAFRTEDLYGAVRGALRTNYDPSRMSFVIGQLRAPLFRKAPPGQVGPGGPAPRKRGGPSPPGLQAPRRKRRPGP